VPALWQTTHAFKMFGMWRASSLLYDHFSLSGTMCLEVAKQFISVVADLNMDKYLHVLMGKIEKNLPITQGCP
jgi:hypothetical protein